MFGSKIIPFVSGPSKSTCNALFRKLCGMFEQRCFSMHTLSSDIRQLIVFELSSIFCWSSFTINIVTTERMVVGVTWSSTNFCHTGTVIIEGCVNRSIWVSLGFGSFIPSSATAAGIGLLWLGKPVFGRVRRTSGMAIKGTIIIS